MAKQDKPPVGQLFSLKEAAAKLSVSERTVTRMINARKITSIKIGRIIRIHEDELRRVMDEGTDAYWHAVYGQR